MLYKPSKTWRAHGSLFLLHGRAEDIHQIAVVIEDRFPPRDDLLAMSG